MSARYARKSGGPVARARGKRRGPRDRRALARADALQAERAFSARIEAWLDQDERRECLHALDLRAFVQSCPHEELGPGARLRRLAVYLDDQVGVWREHPLQEWEIFARIYDEAARFEPASPELFHARALTAVRLGWWRKQGEPGRARLMHEARVAAARGLALADEDPELHFLFGYIAYMEYPSATLEGLESCTRAVELRPEHGLARLYRAHCLHDLERWSEAAEAYAGLEAPQVERPQRWRVELAREQRGHCLWRAGQPRRARELFEAQLARRERAVTQSTPEELELRESPVLREPPVYMAEALFSGDFGEALLARLRRHLERLDQQWVLELDRVTRALE